MFKTKKHYFFKKCENIVPKNIIFQLKSKQIPIQDTRLVIVQSNSIKLHRIEENKVF